VSFEFATADNEVQVWRDPVLKCWLVEERGKLESFASLEDALLHLVNNPRPKKPELRLVKSES
jgi:hypothetical protein